MAKVIRKELEAKLAALGGAEWDSMSEGSLSGDESGAQLDGELKPPPLPLRAHKTKKGGRKEKEVGASVVPVGPAGEPSGVVYVGHIPHGFYEEAMNGFFKQFGDVIRVRVSRSKKSARCKGYAYVEFTSPEVAGIVAETMNGYYLFDKQLVCRVLRFEEVHPNLFDGAGVKFRKVNWHGLYREKYNADRTSAKDERHVAKLVKKDEAKRAKLSALGIEYDFPGFLASLNDRQVETGPFQGKKKRKDEGEQEDSAPSRKRRTASGDAAVPAPAAQPDTTTPASPSPSPSSSKKPKTKGTDADAKAAPRKRGDSSPPVNAKAKANSKSKAKSSGEGTTPNAKKSKPSKVVESPSAPTPPPPSTTGVSPGRKRAAKTPPQKKRKPSAGEEGAAGNVATPLRTGATAAEETVAGGTAKGSVSKKGPKTPLPGGAKSGAVGSEGGKGKSPKSGSRKRSSQQAQDEEEGRAEEGVGSGKARRTKRAKA